MKLAALQLQSQVIKTIRQHLDAQGLVEIAVPVLHQGLPLEPTLFAFSTEWQTAQGDQTFYLLTSPESSLKKALAVGVSDCYALGQCFRNLENSGSTHRPEFLMLEWYRRGAEYPQIMAETEKLVLNVKHAVDRLSGRSESSVLVYQGQKIQLAGPWLRISLDELCQTHVGQPLSELVDDQVIMKVCQQLGYTIENATWEQLFDQLFLNEIEPHLPTQPFFLLDFPARLSPLCKVNPDKPYLAERFEVFIAGMEIGNGNTENLDVDLIEAAFAQENQYRLAQHLASHPIDHSFLDAIKTLAATDESFAGIGLGLDRLVMLMANSVEISEVRW